MLGDIVPGSRIHIQLIFNDGLRRGVNIARMQTVTDLFRGLADHFLKKAVWQPVPPENENGRQKTQ